MKFTKQNSMGRYFLLPNEVFTLGLTSGEIALYSYLLFCENRKTFQCYPSYRSIGSALHMSKNTVRKYVRALEEKQLITTQPTTVYLKNGKAQNGNLLYTILPITHAVEHYIRKKIEEI